MITVFLGREVGRRVFEPIENLESPLTGKSLKP
jgi:hypothetical protein